MYAYLSDLPAVLPVEMEKVDWDMVSLPYFAEQPKVGAQAYPSYFGLTALTQHPNEAMEAIHYLTSDEFQLELSKSGVMPVVTKESIQKAYATESNFKGKHTEALFFNKSAPIPVKTALDPSINSIYKKSVADPLALGTTDMNSAFRLAEEEATKLIQQSKAK
jgi:multiple sugar transport system substrate-binding protein